jgi:hypothetical protein
MQFVNERRSIDIENNKKANEEKKKKILKGRLGFKV